ncbi:Leucine Rich repeats (2 copies) [compost metagenome]
MDLRANRLSALPDSLAELTQLQRLDLRWNNFAEMPAVLEPLIAQGCLVHI